MKEQMSPQEIRAFKEEYVLPSGLTIQEAEELSGKILEGIFINAFAKGIPRHYIDERSAGEREAIRAMPDGSEDLIDFDWQTGQETFVRQLLPPGKGKYAYLLEDPRYLIQIKG